MFNKNISLIFLRSEFYQYNVYNNNNSFELKNNHQMNVMNIKKLCRFGVNCNRKESCKYFHQDQSLDDASISMKHDQIKKKRNLLNCNQQNQCNYTQKYQKGKFKNEENHKYYHTQDNSYENHQYHRDLHGYGYHRGHHGHHKGHHGYHKDHHGHHKDHHEYHKDHHGYHKSYQKHYNYHHERHQQQSQHYQQKNSSQSDNYRSQNSNQLRQTSLSGDTKRRLKKQQDFKKFEQITTQNEQIYQRFYRACQSFFNNRIYNQMKRAKIVEYLIVYAPLSMVQDLILPAVIQLQKQGFVNHFNYKKIIKMFCKRNYDIQETRKTLLKKLDIESKRIQKDKNFQIKFPHPKKFDFLQSEDLLSNQLQNQNIIYLIDGNNCLTTQKHLRYFFQSKQNQKKVEAQCRFRWLLSLALKPQNVFLFFDDQYSQKNYELFKKTILHQIQYQQYQRIKIIFPKQKQNADNAILNKLKELKAKNFVQKIVVITGDRVLTQQCLEICPIQKSSGLYFIKFLKKILKQNLQKQESKKILKRIFNYEN